MNDHLMRVSAAARKAISQKDWARANACATEILKSDSGNAEGHFLTGIVSMAARQPAIAGKAFAKALELDEERYDAAIELARLASTERRNGDAADLLRRYEGKLQASPMYLNLAGSLYTTIGMNEKAWPLYQRANELQPGVDLIEANIATTAVFLGRIDEAKEIFTRLLQKHPGHQRNHLTYARLEKATDTTHIDAMKKILRSTNLPPDRNVFMYYAIGKEYEDLERWNEAFEYFRKAGDGISSVAEYDINKDIGLIDTIIEVCNADWLADGAPEIAASAYSADPIFIVGLPRTGTTLTDRILSSHSKVSSVGETQFMQMVLRRESGVDSEDKMTPQMIEAAAKLDIKIIGDGYMDMLNYRLGDESMFVDKLPFNLLYVGFIAKAFPKARIIHIKRNPMDSCFAMYKQVFTWAYKFSYTLEGLGQFYIAYRRLLEHWKATLGDRLIEIEYEAIVSDQEHQTRRLLEKVGLDFEEDCLNFDQSTAASSTASSVQVREKIHTRSVERWKRYEKQLRPLSEYLENAGVALK